MLYIVLIPDWIWIAAIAAVWTMLARTARRRVGPARLTSAALLGLLAVQGMAASTAAIATSVDPIGRLACTMGHFAGRGTLLLTIFEAGIVLLAWPTALRVARRWIAGWLIYCLVTALAHARSAVLCTV